MGEIFVLVNILKFLFTQFAKSRESYCFTIAANLQPVEGERPPPLFTDFQPQNKSLGVKKERDYEEEPIHISGPIMENQ